MPISLVKFLFKNKCFTKYVDILLLNFSSSKDFNNIIDNLFYKNEFSYHQYISIIFKLNPSNFDYNYWHNLDIDWHIYHYSYK